VEVTPDLLRLRKAVLDGGSRRKTARAAKAAAGV
jgi:predicted membrane GTPase involved in stress response